MKTDADARTLTRVALRNYKPDQIRELRSPDPGDLLNPDGSNLARVLANLKAGSPKRAGRMSEYFSRVVPGTVGIEPKTVGPKLTLEFRQEMRGDRHPWRFLADNVSDGTLRVPGVLMALYQGAGTLSANARLVGIEEPESTLHPAAAGVLADVLLEASERVQVVVTSHSADLLDRGTIPLESFLAVVAEMERHGSPHSTTPAAQCCGIICLPPESCSEWISSLPIPSCQHPRN